MKITEKLYAFAKYLYHNTILNNLVPRRMLVSVFQFYRTKMGLRPHKFLRFEVYLTHHCNLNCAGCFVFSPIAEEKYLDIAYYEKDCKRIHELTNGKIASVRLLGGEPTLHPNLLDFFDITRRYFENAKIQLVTNGTLLCKEDNNFWEACKKKNISIQISKYPININIDEIIEKCKLHNTIIEFTENKTDEMIHLNLDLKGEQNAENSFYHCHLKNNCITLSQGRLYTCTIIPSIKYFNRYFNLELTAKDSDSIDIYKAESIKEILEFLCKPISFCRFCDKKKMNINKWHLSKKDIKEWIK